MTGISYGAYSSDQVDRVTAKQLAHGAVGVANSGTLGFFGVTPIVQPTGAAQATLSLTTIATADSGWQFKTSDGMVQLFAQVEEIRATLVELGLMKGST